MQLPAGVSGCEIKGVYMARRYARRRDPAVRKVQRIELEETNLPLRLFAVGVAIAVAVAAFGYFLSTFLTGDTGWQEIQVSRSETGISSQFILNYNVGASDRGITAEKKAVSLCYGDHADEAYRVLSNVEFEHYQNVCFLNAHPNQAVTVDPVLYRALTLVEQTGSRYPYFAPLFGLYNSLFASETDFDAQKFDPEFDDASRTFVEEIAVFAQNPQAVRVELLGDNQVRLTVSEEYMAYAAQNGVDSFLDLGILLNAFILDDIADALVQQGLTNGSIASFDGYTRSLGTLEYRVNLFDTVSGQLKQTGAADYCGPMSVVNFRQFPMLAKDVMSYYTYADGTTRAPFLGGDGMLRPGCSSLTVFSGAESCAELALRTLGVYTASDFSPEALTAENWAYSENGQVHFRGDAISVKTYS